MMTAGTPICRCLQAFVAATCFAALPIGAQPSLVECSSEPAPANLRDNMLGPIEEGGTIVVFGQDIKTRLTHALTVAPSSLTIGPGVDHQRVAQVASCGARRWLLEVTSAHQRSYSIRRVGGELEWSRSFAADVIPDVSMSCDGSMPRVTWIEGGEIHLETLSGRVVTLAVAPRNERAEFQLRSVGPNATVALVVPWTSARPPEVLRIESGAIVERISVPGAYDLEVAGALVMVATFEPDGALLLRLLTSTELTRVAETRILPSEAGRSVRFGGAWASPAGPIAIATVERWKEGWVAISQGGGKRMRSQPAHYAMTSLRVLDPLTGALGPALSLGTARPGLGGWIGDRLVLVQGATTAGSSGDAVSLSTARVRRFAISSRAGSGERNQPMVTFCGQRLSADVVAVTCTDEGLSDLSPLHHLPRVEELHLHLAKGLTDIAVVGQLKKLKRLSLYELGVTDLGPLSSLAGIEEISLRELPTTDLSPLSGLSRLKALELSLPGLTDLIPLAGLTRLERLILHLTERADLSVFAHLRSLRVLEISGQRVTDVGAVQHVAKLESLQIENVQLKTLPDLSTAKRLTSLVLDCWGGAEVSPLSGSPHLRKLVIRGCGLEKISETGWFGLLASLEELEICNTRTSDFSGLDKLTRLRRLEICEQPVDDVSWISNLVSLRALSLSGTRVRDVSALAALISIQELSLPRSVASLAPLVGMVGLEELEVAGPAAAELSVLRGMSKLRRLAIRWANTPDLAPIAALTHLETIEFTGVDRCRFLPLASVKSLREIVLGDTDIDSRERAYLIRSIPNLAIRNRAVCHH